MSCWSELSSRCYPVQSLYPVRSGVCLKLKLPDFLGVQLPISRVKLPNLSAEVFQLRFQLLKLNNPLLVFSDALLLRIRLCQLLKGIGQQRTG